MPVYDRLPLMIVGAGPTGLSAALFLAQRGVPVRIIDAAEQPSATSRALLVNPRTLQLLQPSGVTARITAQGYPVTGATVHRRGGEVASIDLRAELPALLPIGLAQSRTEALLADALRALGVEVERLTRLQALQQDAAGVTLVLRRADGSVQAARAPLVFGADGARSTVRGSLDIEFAGSSLPEPWQLWDLQLDTPLNPNRAHIALVADGFLFMMRLQAGRWRVIGNGADPLANLPGGSVPGAVAWQSHFHIAHRLADSVCMGRVALGGDAAHIHSPLGARGMNLGIEDAWVFADCAADAMAGQLARMEDYAALRQPIHRQVVHRVALITRFARGRPAPLRWLRDALAPRLIQTMPARRVMVRTISGLDHPLRSRR